MKLPHRVVWGEGRQEEKRQDGEGRREEGKRLCKAQRGVLVTSEVAIFIKLLVQTNL